MLSLSNGGMKCGAKTFKSPLIAPPNPKRCKSYVECEVRFVEMSSHWKLHIKALAPIKRVTAEDAAISHHRITTLGYAPSFVPTHDEQEYTRKVDQQHIELGHITPSLRLPLEACIRSLQKSYQVASNILVGAPNTHNSSSSFTTSRLHRNRQAVLLSAGT